MEENTVSTQTERVCEALGIEAQQIRVIQNVCSDIPGKRLAVAAGTIHKPRVNPHGAISVEVDGKLLGLKPDEFECIYPTGPALDAAIEEKLVDKGMSWLERRDGGTVSKINGSEYSCRIWCWGRKGKGHGRTKLDARLNACEAAFCGGGK